MKTLPQAPKFKSYVEPINGHGIQGLTLTLNLAQCQKLKDLLNKGIIILNSPEDNKYESFLLQESKNYIIELMPLLKNFEIFESPNDIDLF